MVINHFLASRIQFQFLYRTKVCVCMCDQLVCALVQSSVSYAAGERFDKMPRRPHFPQPARARVLHSQQYSSYSARLIAHLPDLHPAHL